MLVLVAVFDIADMHRSVGAVNGDAGLNLAGRRCLGSSGNEANSDDGGSKAALDEFGEHDCILSLLCPGSARS